MTREEAIAIFKGFKFLPREMKAVDMAIEALDQENTLDKIRAEIENDWQLKKYPSSPFACGLKRAIEIIDKYKAESEDKE